LFSEQNKRELLINRTSERVKKERDNIARIFNDRLQEVNDSHEKELNESKLSLQKTINQSEIERIQQEEKYNKDLQTATQVRQQEQLSTLVTSLKKK